MGQKYREVIEYSEMEFHKIGKWYAFKIRIKCLIAIVFGRSGLVLGINGKNLEDVNLKLLWFGKMEVSSEMLQSFIVDAYKMKEVQVEVDELFS